MAVLCLAGLGVLLALLLPPVLPGPLVSPVIVALMVLGGCLILAATTSIVMMAAPPAWGRSPKARLFAFGLFVVGLTLSVPVPLLLSR